MIHYNALNYETYKKSTISKIYRSKMTDKTLPGGHRTQKIIYLDIYHEKLTILLDPYHFLRIRKR